jgi:transcriptional regulator with XRE-family HTH domain
MERNKMTAKTIDKEMNNLHQMIVNVASQRSPLEIEKTTGIDNTQISHVVKGRKKFSRRKGRIFEVAKLFGIECAELEERFNALKPAIIEMIRASKEKNAMEFYPLDEMAKRTGFTRLQIGQMLNGDIKFDENKLTDIAQKFGL